MQVISASRVVWHRDAVARHGGCARNAKGRTAIRARLVVIAAELARIADRPEGIMYLTR